VHHNNVTKIKNQHFSDLMADVKIIIGMNGYIWVYFSTVKLESDYFTEDISKIQPKDANEVN